MKNTPDVIKASYKRVDCKINIINIDCILLGYIKTSLKNSMESELQMRSFYLGGANKKECFNKR